MTTHAAIGFSPHSAGEAISAALNMAMSGFHEEAENVHIIVSGVLEIDGQWKAIVSVVIEPKLTKKPEAPIERVDHKPHLDDNKELEEKYAHGLADDLAKEFDIFPTSFVYLPTKHEDLAQELQQKYDYVYVIPAGSTWDHIEDYLLDIKFYEATHLEELRLKQEAEAKALSAKLDKTIQPKPKLNHLIQDMVMDYKGKKSA